VYGQHGHKALLTLYFSAR